MEGIVAKINKNRYLCRSFLAFGKVKVNYKQILDGFIRKLRFKYRVSITNENTLEETWYTRLSRVSVAMFVSGFLLLSFILLTLLIYMTPLRHYLPGYQDSGNRAAIIQQSMRADSLHSQVELMSTYLDVLKANIADTKASDKEQSLDTAEIKEQAVELMKRSKREEVFVKKYEETEKYNLGAISTTSSLESAYVFFKPVDGVIASTYSPSDGKFGVSVITSPHETVKSVLEGKVIFAEFTFENGWVIQVQHENDYVSVYKNNTRLLKQTGASVKAGQSIAVTGAEGEGSAGKHFYFELWRKGASLNPQDVITFRY